MINLSGQVAGILRNDEHHALMDAATTGKVEETVNLLKAHYRRTLAIVSQSLR